MEGINSPLLFPTRMGAGMRVEGIGVVPLPSRIVLLLSPAIVGGITFRLRGRRGVGVEVGVEVGVGVEGLKTLLSSPTRSRIRNGGRRRWVGGLWGDGIRVGLTEEERKSGRSDSLCFFFSPGASFSLFFFFLLVRYNDTQSSNTCFFIWSLGKGGNPKIKNLLLTLL